ncbi:MAG: thioredoxin family protein [Hyphomonadaceae bacterium]|nr:thioredoxin family protein [Hyphomonadaceae bacterium]
MSLLIVCMVVLGGSAHAAQTGRVDTGKVVAQLVSTHDSVAPGQDFYIALRTELDPGWHTYWRNPGDSGEPVQITWDVPETLTYGDMVWPLPYPIATGPIINYGFEGVPFFPVKFTVSGTARAGDVLNINADIYYLVCADVCIPEDTRLSLEIPVGEGIVDTRWSRIINYEVSKAPMFGNARAGLIQSSDNVVLTVQNLPEGADPGKAYFFPFEQGIIEHSEPQTVTIGADGFQLVTGAGFSWGSGTPENVNGLISYNLDGGYTGELVSVISGEALDVGVAPVKAPLQADGAAVTFTATDNVGIVAPVKALLQADGTGLWGAVIGALIGGLILNLMPCVFPVISLKMLSIAKMAHGERGAVQKETWIYTAGVIATFAALTLFLILLKESWGFQLQSPPVVGALALLLFVVGLNLLGVFEVNINLAGTSTSNNAFFTGALAVIVATPCTAPFMAGAIGFALTQSVPVIIAVFLALATGFALPFLVIAYVPGLLKHIPKPGPWMVRFREFLAFPMFAAAVWLVWVLTLQAGETGLLRLLAAFLGVSFAIWLFKRKGLFSRGVAILAVMAALSTTLMLHPKAVAYEGTQAWSPEKVAELRAEGRAVFVDFTAAWCVTCQANKKAVLDSEAVREAFARTNTAFLVADWTNKNDAIKAELARHGRSGVPLYLLFTPGHNYVSPEILPQILTKDVVIRRLEAAMSNAPRG